MASTKNDAGNSAESANAGDQANTPSPFPVVGIGASAGGLEAITQLLEHLPPDLGMAYVVVQHLSSNHKSILPELLDKKTRMPVHLVSDGIRVEADNVYVIPPGTYMSMVEGHLSIANRTREEKSYRVIDHFLESLAPVYQNRAIAIILSGVGSDGTFGVQAVKAEGGITFAQDDSALFQAMAHNAYSSGYVDFILSPEAIARELSSLAQQNYPLIPAEQTPLVNEREIKKIHSMLLKKFGVDFSLYKQTTISRRIMRRMALSRQSNLQQYIGHLHNESNEMDLLYRDLLINVTSFFREPELFAALTKKIFPAVMNSRKADEPIRIWIPACSSGEEACSMGIALFEFLGDEAMTTPIQIFATDLSESAIDKARSGIYASNLLQNVSAQRLRQFFVKIDGSYQIIKPIRDICVFATHNLLKDPPFSRIDLISCQNVMIYFSSAAQKKILQAFHYALKPEAYLLLGKSETVGGDISLFHHADKEQKIYQKKAGSHYPQFDFFSQTQQSSPANLSMNGKLRAIQASAFDIEKETDKVLLSRYVPASIVVNKDLQILRFNGPVESFLQPAAGKASLHLLKMLKEDLVFELRGVYSRVKKQGQPVKKNGIHFSRDGLSRQISIEITPMKSNNAETYYLIVFQEELRPIWDTQDGLSYKKGKRQDLKDKRITALEYELREARDHIKSMNEEFEATREELQSANEEVLSSNEELQSINEELETSKEELQSTNEELTTINEELQLRNADLRETLDYVQAIVETIREPLVVLNPDLRIRTANKAFYSVFGVQDEIEGHFLYDVSNGLLDVPELRAQLQKTISRGMEFLDFELKHNFKHLGEKILLFNAMRMIGEGSRARILLAVEDVTERRHAEDALRKSEERLRLVIESATEYAIFTLDAAGIIQTWSSGAVYIFGYQDNEIVGKNCDMLYTPQDREQDVPATEIRTALKNGSATDERWHLRKDGSRFYASGVMSRTLNNGVQGLVKIARDLTDKKLAEQQRDQFIGIASHELKTPVTSIKSYTELLQETLVPLGDEAAVPLINKLSVQVERLARLVTDLLDVTKISEGELPLNKSEFFINELVRTTVEEMQLTTRKQHMVLELADDRMIVADRERIEQVLTNLISNAVKYSPLSDKIIISTDVAEGKVTVCVKDFGIGMTHKTLSHVFERFYRAEEMQVSTFPGLGLGLFIAADIVRRHGGEIWVTSEKNEGTVFCFSIPVRVH